MWSGSGRDNNERCRNVELLRVDDNVALAFGKYNGSSLLEPIILEEINSELSFSLNFRNHLAARVED